MVQNMIQQMTYEVKKKKAAIIKNLNSLNSISSKNKVSSQPGFRLNLLLDAGWLIYVKWAARLLSRAVYRRHTGQLKVEWSVRPKGIKTNI